MDSEAFNKALWITLYGMAGIFLFMMIFYIAIRVIDKAFPRKAEK
ncbi:MAG: OadG-related small transporter subunit [Bacteroidota bacterium]